MNTSDIFKDEISNIQNSILRQAVIDTLNASPECIQVIPASSSGKYHSQGDCMAGYIDEHGITHTGGLVNHIKCVTAVALSLMQSGLFENIVGDTIKELIENSDFMPTNEKLVFYKDIVADSAIASCIIHDCCKPDSSPEHKTVFEHPLLAAKLFSKCSEKYLKLDRNMKIFQKLICQAVESHMGIWRTSKYSDVILPVPIDGLSVFVHLCDYIASRKFIEINLTKV